MLVTLDMMITQGSTRVQRVILMHTATQLLYSMCRRVYIRSIIVHSNEKSRNRFLAQAYTHTHARYTQNASIDSSVWLVHGHVCTWTVVSCPCPLSPPLCSVLNRPQLKAISHLPTVLINGRLHVCDGCSNKRNLINTRTETGSERRHTFWFHAHLPNDSDDGCFWHLQQALEVISRWDISEVIPLLSQPPHFVRFQQRRPICQERGVNDGKLQISSS